MKNFIPRPLYMKKIAPFVNKDVIKVIIGQRRVGKSYLMYQIIDALKKASPGANVIYVNKELYEFDQLKNYRHLIQHVKEQKMVFLGFLFLDIIHVLLSQS